MKKFVVIILLAILVLTGCTSVKVDYEDWRAVETAIKECNDFIGKTARIQVSEINLALIGYTINPDLENSSSCYVFEEHPGVKKGDTITVRILDVINLFGYYFIEAELVK